MPQPPRLPAKTVIKAIIDRLARYDRQPFQEHLAVALAPGIAPSASAVRKMAKKNPESWSRYVTGLAKISGFAERSEKLTMTLDPSAMAKELVARYGTENARMMLTAAGLPVSLIPVITITAPVPESVTIDGESEAVN